MNKHLFALAASLGLIWSSSVAAGSLLALPAPDIAALLADEESKSGPYRFAAPVPVAITPLTHGSWTRDEDTQLWRLEISTPGAQHLNFGFTRFSLPAGAALTLTAPDGSDRRGPYQASDAIAGQLWTPVIRGDRAVLELRLPAGVPRAAAALTLGRVNYGFRGFGAKDAVIGKSGDCNVDVVCPDGDEWRDEIRSVARFTVGGALLCTGQLVNNTAQDFTPYFLTASHCASDALAPTTVFYWNYETSTCGTRNPDGVLDQTQRGALLMASSLAATAVGSDFTLLRLLAQPDPAFRVFYSGWDRRDLAPKGVTAIHHPAGDEKRISFEFDQTEIAPYLEAASPDGTGSHLRVPDWDVGTTEGGSSGSGIWNAEHRLVGTLSGGFAACGNDDADWYGRFHQHWDANPTPLTGVAFWLDPAGTGADVLDGVDPNPQASAAARSGSGLLAGGGLTLVTLTVLLGAALRRRR